MLTNEDMDALKAAISVLNAHDHADMAAELELLIEVDDKIPAELSSDEPAEK